MSVIGLLLHEDVNGIEFEGFVDVIVGWENEIGKFGLQGVPIGFKGGEALDGAFGVRGL